MPKNIYICGLPRGGTTLTTLALGAHPEALPMGETMYLAKTDPTERVCSCGAVGCAHAQRIFEQVSTIPAAHDTHHAYGALDVKREPNKVASRDTIRSTAPAGAAELGALICSGAAGIEAIATVFAQTYDTAGKVSLIDNTKEIAFAPHLKPATWEPVIVTRDLRGVAHSVLKAAERKGVPRSIEAKLPVWQDFTERAKALLAAGALHVRYEDICAGSIRMLQTLGERVGWRTPYHPKLLHEPYEHHMLRGNRAARQWNLDGGLRSQDDAWRALLPADQQAMIREAVPDFYETFEYE